MDFLFEEKKEQQQQKKQKHWDVVYWAPFSSLNAEKLSFGGKHANGDAHTMWQNEGKMRRKCVIPAVELLNDPVECRFTIFKVPFQ